MINGISSECSGLSLFRSSHHELDDFSCITLTNNFRIKLNYNFFPAAHEYIYLLMTSPMESLAYINIFEFYCLIRKKILSDRKKCAAQTFDDGGNLRNYRVCFVSNYVWNCLICEAYSHISVINISDRKNKHAPCGTNFKLKRYRSVCPRVCALCNRITVVLLYIINISRFGIVKFLNIMILMNGR